MEDLVLDLTRGNPTEVKVVLATVVTALAVYQLTMIARAYGKLRLPFTSPAVASRAHRATGDTIVAVTVVTATICISVFGFESEELAHVVVASSLLAVLALKIVVVRRGGRLGRFLPVLGLTVFALFVATWLTSAGPFLFDS